MKDLIGVYGKFIVAFLAAAAGAAYMYLEDGAVSGQEWVLIVLAGLGALGVYATPRKPIPPEA